MKSLQSLKELFLENLAESGGVITTASQKTKIHRDTVYDWMKKDTNFSLSVKDYQKRRERIDELGDFSKELSRPHYGASMWWLPK